MKKLVFIIGFLLLFGKSYSQWFYQNNPDSITTISSGSFINSNTGWYARAKGQISKTTDGGLTWNTITVDVNDLNSIKFVNANVGYVCGNNGRLMKSINGGINWSIQNTSSNDTLIAVDFVNELTGWCAGRDFIIYTSNGGSQWYRQNIDTNTIKPRFTVLKMYDSQNGLAGAYGKNFIGMYAYIFKTSNGGINWRFVDSVNGYRIYSVCYVNQNIVYLSNYQKLYKSINSGANWNFVTSLPGNTGYYPKIQFKDENTGWLIRGIDIFTTFNGGINWSYSLVSDYSSFYDLIYTTNNNIFAFTSKGTIFKSTNEGLNWGNYSINIESYLQNISIIDANNIFVSGSFGDVWKSTNSGINWQNKFRNNVSEIKGPVFVNSNTGFLCSAQKLIYKSTNAGENWFQIGGAIQHNVFSIYCKEENNLWVYGDSGMILKTTNSGVNWENKSIYLTNLVYGLKENNNILFIKVYNFDYPFFKSTDLGNSWINIPLDTMQFSFNLFFLNSQIGWVIPTIGNNFYKSNDGGNTWIKYYRQVENDLQIINCFFINENTGFAATVATNYGVIKTTNSGFNWFVNTNISNYNCWTYNVSFLNENTGWVVGSSGLILKTTNCGTSFISINNQNIPDKYSLSQNYPNPFNPSTNIKYQLVNNKFVSLKVYDILGKEVATLMNEFQRAGTYVTQFSKNQLPSGVYFYSLYIDGVRIDTKKMILLK
jgi:photosystem II stability/assembly factor-like uncharacterized protein